MFLPLESRRRWDCGGKAYDEWTHEGLAEINRNYASRELHPLKRKHTCQCMKRAAQLRKLGGTAEIMVFVLLDKGLFISKK
jgi:hypothetical protein